MKEATPKSKKARQLKTTPKNFGLNEKITVHSTMLSFRRVREEKSPTTMNRSLLRRDDNIKDLSLEYTKHFIMPTIRMLRLLHFIRMDEKLLFEY